MARRAMHRQSRRTKLANLGSGLDGAPRAPLFLADIHCLFTPALLLLPFLKGNDLVGITNALALVRLRRSNATDLGGGLTYALAVSALDHDLGRAGRLNRDAIRN